MLRDSMLGVARAAPRHLGRQWPAAPQLVAGTCNNKNKMSAPYGEHAP